MRNFRLFELLCIAALVVCLMATNANASPTWSDEDPAIMPGIPDYTPSKESVEKGVGCAEIAAANVIGYWDSHGLPNLVPDGTTPDQLMQNLIKYDVRFDVEKGLKNYYKEKQYAEYANYIKDIDATWDNVLSEMKKSELLILSFTWGIARGHCVTIAGWDVTDQNGNPLKQLGFHDPVNPAVLNSKGYTYSEDNTDFYKVELGAKGYFSFKYQGDNDVNVTNLTSISVPEPASLVLAVLGMGTAVSVLRRRKALR